MRNCTRVIPRHFPACEVVCIPVADGGEGTVDCFIQGHGRAALRSRSQTRWVKVRRRIRAARRACDNRNGRRGSLPQVGALRCPGTATTYGVGELIAHAAHLMQKDTLGLGGSATNDGGRGRAAALGVRFYDADGQSFVPVGDTLGRIARIDTAKADELLRSVEITVMRRHKPALRPDRRGFGVFAPQKGADAEKVKSLDAGLRHFGDVIRSQLGIDVSRMPGAGAAGGMGAGLRRPARRDDTVRYRRGARCHGL